MAILSQISDPPRMDQPLVQNPTSAPLQIAAMQPGDENLTQYRRPNAKELVSDNILTAATVLTQFRLPSEQEIVTARGGGMPAANLYMNSASWGMVDAMTGKLGSKILPKVMQYGSKLLRRGGGQVVEESGESIFKNMLKEWGDPNTSSVRKAELEPLIAEQYYAPGEMISYAENRAQMEARRSSAPMADRVDFNKFHDKYGKRFLDDPKTMEYMNAHIKKESIWSDYELHGMADNITKGGDDFVKSWFENPTTQQKIIDAGGDLKSILNNLSTLESRYTDRGLGGDGTLGRYYDLTDFMNPDRHVSVVNSNLKGNPSARTVAVHEGTHQALKVDVDIPEQAKDMIKGEMLERETFLNIIKESNEWRIDDIDYLRGDGEIYARVMQVRDYASMKPGDKISMEQLDKAVKKLKEQHIQPGKSYGIDMAYMGETATLKDGPNSLLRLVNGLPFVGAPIVMMNDKTKE